MPGASEDQPERLADLGVDCYHRGAVVATETVGNRSWGGLMAFYWPRIYRFLDRSSIAYHLDDLPAEDQPPVRCVRSDHAEWGRTLRIQSRRPRPMSLTTSGSITLHGPNQLAASPYRSLVISIHFCPLCSV